MQIFTNSFVFLPEELNKIPPAVTSKDAKDLLARIDQDIASGKLDASDINVSTYRTYVESISISDGFHPPFPPYPEYKEAV